MFWVPLLAGVGLGGATVALMVLGGVLNQFTLSLRSSQATRWKLLSIRDSRQVSRDWQSSARARRHGYLPPRCSGWWGPFCLGVDVVLAMALATMLWRRKILE